MLFSLFQPRCPLNAGEKTWIEYRMSWLLEHLGAERLKRIEPVLPTGAYFPLPYQGEPEQIRAVFERVCQYMEVEPGRYRLHFFDDTTDEQELPPPELREGAIIYEPNKSEGGAHVATFHVHKSPTLDLELMIAVFSQKIGESMLRAQPDLDLEEAESRHTIELLPLFYGLGIFSANAVMREQVETTMGWHSWAMVSTGAMPARYYGYAIALLCWLREESLPAWRSHLRRDAEETLKASLRYLEKTGDTILDRDAPAKPYLKSPLSQWLADLHSGTPSRRVAALWAIERNPSVIHPGEHVALIAENLRHRDPVVRAAAARALDRLGETASEAVHDLIIALDDRHGSVRTVAALALGSMPSCAEESLPGLLPLLRDSNIHVSNAAAWAMGQFGRKAEEAGPALVHLLRRGILRCTRDSLDDILNALLAVTGHPEEVIMETLLERDAESCQRALDLLKEHQIDAMAQES